MQSSLNKPGRGLLLGNVAVLIAALTGAFVYHIKDFSILSENDMTIAGDSAWYATYADSCHFSTWHSILLLNEIKYISNLLGLKALQSLWVLSCIIQALIVACSVRITILLYKKDRKFLWIGSIYAFFVATCSFYYEFSMYMEHYMFGFLLLAILATLEFCRCRTLGKCFWLAVILISLFHVVGYRRNAAVILPLFSLYLIPGKWLYRKLVLRGMVALSCAAAFYFICEYISSHVLTVNHHAYPATPMVVSDLKISALLRGEQQAFHNTLKQRCNLVCQKGEECVGEAYVENAPIMSKESWDSLLNIYIEEWRNHPVEMFAARSIQAFQLYVTRRIPNLLTDCYTRNFPALKDNEKAWQSAHFWWGYIALTKELITFLIVLGTVASLCILCAIRKYREQKELIWISGIAVVYICSFLVVIPGPYPAFRYMYPVAFISFWVFACLIAKSFTNKHAFN